MLDWELTIPAFAARFGASSLPESKAQTGPGTADSLFLPFGLVSAARRETEKRGIEYAGHYDLFRRSFGRPGKFVRCATLIRPRDGLLEYREGVAGFEHRGWALLMLNRLYMITAEEKYESMCFHISNAGQQPRARCIGSITLSMSSDGLLTPTAAPSVFIRAAEITGDIEVDDAHYEQRKLQPAYVEPGDMPREALDYISRDIGPSAAALGGTLEMRAPYLH